LQVVLGPIADQVAGEIRAALRSAIAPAAQTPPAAHDAPALLAALGGRDNVVDLASAAGRLLIRTARPDKVDESALVRLGIRGIAHSATDRVQLLVAGPVEEWDQPLRLLL
jgi:PTS system N-acetylglucosamine-specific IIC component